MTGLNRDTPLRDLWELIADSKKTAPILRAVWEGTEACPNERGVASRARFAQENILVLADLLTRQGERSINRLPKVGPTAMMDFQSYLNDKGFETDWPTTDSHRARSEEFDSRIRLDHGRGLSLERAIEQADKFYAAKTGEEVGTFSRKVRENSKAQENGARLKGRSSL